MENKKMENKKKENKKKENKKKENKKRLVSEINNIKENKLDSFVEEYFEENLKDKKEILRRFKDREISLNINACIWALTFAEDCENFDGLIVDEYQHYSIVADLDYILCDMKLKKCISKLSIVRIGLSKEFRYIYEFEVFDVREGLKAANEGFVEEAAEYLERIVNTSSYAFNKTFFSNIRQKYILIEKEMLKAICEMKEELKITPVDLFEAIHDPFILKTRLVEELKYSDDIIKKDIETIFSNPNIRASYINIPRLMLEYTPTNVSEYIIDQFSFDEIVNSIRAECYFDITTYTLCYTIMYMLRRFPDRFSEFEELLLNYIYQEQFYIEYKTITAAVCIINEIRSFEHFEEFKKAIFNIHFAIGLYKDFKSAKESSYKELESLKTGVRYLLLRGNFDFEYFIDLVSRIIDFEDKRDVQRFEEFKNLLM